jgi:1-acyl-sn-glycerol-3-phosphate acyltransferase
MSSVAQFDARDTEFVRPAESPLDALRRRFSGRYPVDAFGLDPQLADIVAPIVGLGVRVHIEGEGNVPSTGPAAIVANRGFGLMEPAALGIAVRHATGRRLRIVGAPTVPILGGFVRRLGAIGASETDIAVALRAGHLVGVPLSPTWLRTSAGIPPHGLVRALTHAPIIPAAVVAKGPLGTPLTWHVRFGPLVTLSDPYDPNDPLAAARFADAMRASVRGLLVSGTEADKIQ